MPLPGGESTRLGTARGALRRSTPRGTLVKPKRHVVHVWDLEGREAEELGPLLRETTRALAELTDPKTGLCHPLVAHARRPSAHPLRRPSGHGSADVRVRRAARCAATGGHVRWQRVATSGGVDAIASRLRAWCDGDLRWVEGRWACRLSCALREKIGNDLLVLPTVAGLVTDDRGRVLLIRHSNDGNWVLPSGCVEPDEHPADRLVAEMREETGLEVRPTSVVGVYGGPDCRIRYPNGDQVSCIVTLFACEVTSGEPTADGDESLDVRFFSELPALNVSRIGRTLLDGRGSPFQPPESEG